MIYEPMYNQDMENKGFFFFFPVETRRERQWPAQHCEGHPTVNRSEVSKVTHQRGSRETPSKVKRKQ